MPAHIHSEANTDLFLAVQRSVINAYKFIELLPKYNTLLRQ